VTSSNEQPAARRGFLASLSSALSPQPIPENDTGPLKPPRGVLTATVLAIIAGAVYLFAGTVSVAGLDAALQQQRADYATQIQDCNNQFGGIGTTAVTATSPTGAAATCQRMITMAPSDWDSYRTASMVLAVAFIVMGALLVVAGWFLRAGRAWARRCIVAIAIVTVLAALMLGMSSPILLAATLLVMVAVVLCYLASGATYFMRVKARRHA
jgi:hypothetical protein